MPGSAFEPCGISQANDGAIAWHVAIGTRLVACVTQWCRVTRFQEREPDSGSSNLMLAPLVG